MSELPHKIRTSFICTIPSVVATQALVQAGADTVVIDREHGAIGRENLHAMIASTAGTNCRPVVRVGKRDEAMVKLALDMGAAGIVFPQVNTAQEASDCVAMTRYSPRGRRGFGPHWAFSMGCVLSRVFTEARWHGPLQHPDRDKNGDRQHRGDLCCRGHQYLGPRAIRSFG
jgi:2-keto-3-deoxy-L-rhamnonate aldolase RhmA